MEELGVEELKQLVNYYRQKASDNEFQLLQTQIKLHKLIIQQATPVPATKVTKNKSE